MLEVNNTKAILIGLLNLNYEDQSALVNASIDHTMFCKGIGDFSERLISQAVIFVQNNSGDIKLLIRSFLTWGQLYGTANNLERAQEKLQAAERLYLTLGQRQRKCLHEHWKNCHDYPEAHTWESRAEEDIKEKEKAACELLAAEDDSYLAYDEVCKVRQLMLAERLLQDEQGSRDTVM
ncbi:hypothetical protein EI94DRAFT_1896552 [Lactarius quietus]|nr:hypothetical protein EI94DRAFT_1896552 [Lactarius quietus]